MSVMAREDWCCRFFSQKEILDPPVIIATELSSPEGIAMHPNGKEIPVVEAGSNSLLAINLTTGAKRLVANDLGLMPGIDKLPFGYPNDIVDLDGSLYINGDGANVIYSIQDEEESTSLATSHHVDMIQYVWSFALFLLCLMA